MKRIRDLIGRAPKTGRPGARAFAGASPSSDWLMDATGICLDSFKRMRPTHPHSRWPTLIESKKIAEALECTEMELVEEIARAHVEWRRFVYETQKAAKPKEE